MNRKNNTGVPERIDETNGDNTNDLNYTLSEGSTFVFNADEFIGEDDVYNTKSLYFSCEQIDGILVENSRKETDRMYSFRAPYLQRSNDLYAVLRFRLTFKANGSDGKTIKRLAKVVVKRVHRVMIFQGGVALGAYEAGVFKALVEKLTEDENKRRSDLGGGGRPLFDIVAGASIGAMNGAIVVSSVTNGGKALEDGKTWTNSAESVIKFWRAQQQLPTIADVFDTNEIYRCWRDSLHSTSKALKRSAMELIEYNLDANPSVKSYGDMLATWLFVEPSFWKDYFINSWYIPATAEATRRYYSARQFLRTTGPFNVATGTLSWQPFGKFFDFWNTSNLLPLRPDNKHFVLFSLKNTLERFTQFPIQTYPEKKEPRLLLVSVDVKTGEAVTFDSYTTTAQNNHDIDAKYNSGIKADHALASGTFPDFFDYPKFKVNNLEADSTNGEHVFWDGGFRSNTPLREVIQAHRDHWLSVAKNNHQDEKEYGYENDVPDLEVYIADLWPSELKEDPLSFDRDFVENRKWDLILGDKTDYDEQVANVITDYVDLARRLKNLAGRRGVHKEEIAYILDGFASSLNTKGIRRVYKELLEGRFRLTKVVRIDRKDDGNEVHDKVFDYSCKTIEKLISDGYQDAIVQLDLQQINDRVRRLLRILGNTSIENVKEDQQIGKIQEILHQIQERMRIGTSDHTELNELLGSFINSVESLESRDNVSSLKDEKELLINAAKQFEYTLNKSAKMV